MEMISPSFWSFDGLRLESGLELHHYKSYTPLGYNQFFHPSFIGGKGLFRDAQLTGPLRLGATQLMECWTKATFIRWEASLEGSLFFWEIPRGLLRAKRIKSALHQRDRVLETELRFKF